MEETLMRVACLLFLSPVQHESPRRLLELVRELRAEGHEVTVLMIGDGIYNSYALLKNSTQTVQGFSELKDVRIMDCITCTRSRGAGELIGNARTASLEEFVETIETSDVVLNYTGEA